MKVPSGPRYYLRGIILMYIHLFRPCTSPILRLSCVGGGHPHTIHPNETNHPTRNLPKRNCRGGACVPARTSAQGRFHTKNIRIVRGEFNDGCALAGRHGRAHRHRPYQFFHAIPHKPNNHLHAILPNDINRSHAIYPNCINHHAQFIQTKP